MRRKEFKASRFNYFFFAIVFYCLAVFVYIIPTKPGYEYHSFFGNELIQTLCIGINFLFGCLSFFAALIRQEKIIVSKTGYSRITGKVKKSISWTECNSIELGEHPFGETGGPLCVLVNYKNNTSNLPCDHIWLPGNRSENIYETMIEFWEYRSS